MVHRGLQYLGCVGDLGPAPRLQWSGEAEFGWLDFLASMEWGIMVTIGINWSIDNW